VQDCERMIDACERNGVRLMTANRLHFERCNLEVADIVRRKRIGDARWFDSQFSMQVKKDNIRIDAELGGGPEYDIGIYCINAARMLLDAEPVRVSAFAIHGARSEMPEVDETTAAMLHFDGDRLAVFSCSFDAADLSTYRLVGTKGEISVSPAFATSEALAYTMTIGDTTTRKRGRKLDQFAAELAYFSRCILDDTAPEPSGEEGAWDVRIIRAIYESARLGAAVTLPPFAEPGPDAAQRDALPPVRRQPLVRIERPHD
jgi:predicted dehydrogenase